MKKFGFGKIGDGDLFRRSKNNSSDPTPAASNPYAAADSYTPDQKNGNTGQSASNQSPALNSGYGPDKYGSGSGYGANRYDNSGSAHSAGGYGGLGNRNSNETSTTEDNRDALFGGAKDRYAQRGGPAAGSGAGNRFANGYGEERQLTAEEEEEEEVAAAKQEIRQMKRDDVSSTQRALAIAAQAEESGRATLARLGAQGERLHNTEKNLDLTSNHNRKAEEKAKELKTLNRSMFAVHVGNPFTSSSRRAARDEEINAKHLQEREQRELTRQAAFSSRQRMESNLKNLQPGDAGYRAGPTKTSLAERSKYQFEADSEDEEMENQIDRNLDALGHAAGRLNALARATGQEVEEQNKHIDRIMMKSDRVDDQIAMNRARLDRIK